MRPQILFVFAALFFCTCSVFAQLPLKIGAGIRIGSETTDNRLVLGVQVDGKLSRFHIVPNYEYVSLSGGKIHQLNFDVQADILGQLVAKIFIGGGYVVSILSPDQGDSRTKGGYNIQAGARADLPIFQVFGLAKYVKVSGLDSYWALLGGITFRLF